MRNNAPCAKSRPPLNQIIQAMASAATERKPHWFRKPEGASPASLTNIGPAKNSTHTVVRRINSGTSSIAVAWICWMASVTGGGRGLGLGARVWDIQSNFGYEVGGLSEADNALERSDGFGVGDASYSGGIRIRIYATTASTSG